MMLTKEDSETLARHVADLGLLGDHWLPSDDGDLHSALSEALPGVCLRKGIPEADDLDGRACVVVLDPDQEDRWQHLAGQLRSTKFRPLLILISESPELSEAMQESLRALGYQLPPTAIEEIAAWRVEPAEYDHKRHFDVAGYWEHRYSSGRDSGAGSYGRLARFKAQFLNRFVEEHGVETVIEFGCGDGAQLGLAQYPQYLGLDVSQTAIDQCCRLFEGDDSKRFKLYDPESFDAASYQAELGLSLDVIYHLANDQIYKQHLQHLFATSTRYVVIYSNSDPASVAGVDESAAYMRFRDFLDDIERWHPEWSLVAATANRFPYSAFNPGNTSISDFYVFEMLDAGKASAPEAAEIIDQMALHKVLNALIVADENTRSLGGTVAGNAKTLLELKQRVQQLLDRLNPLELASGRQLRSLLEKVHGQINQVEASRRREQDEVMEAIAQCNRTLEKYVEELQARLEEKQRELSDVLNAYGELNDRTLPQLEQRLSEANQARQNSKHQIGELADSLSRAEAELAKAKEHDIPGLKRQIEAEQLAAKRSVNELKRSLTWQAGTCFREAAGSFRGLVRLPVALLKIWRSARQDRTRPHSVIKLQSGPTARFEPEAESDSWIGLDETPNWLQVALKHVPELAVWGRLRVAPAKGESIRCGLIRIEYLDAGGAVIAGEYGGANFSTKVGHYKYLWFRSEQEDELFRLRPPKEAYAVRLGFQSWQFSDRLEVANELRLVPVQPSGSLPARRFTPPSTAVQEAGTLGWPDPPDNGKPLVLGVMDEFTESCFSDELRLVQPRPDNWYALAMKYRPVMVFVESAWKGNGGSWQYRVGSYSIKPGRELEEMMTWAHQEGIPSIFWNKEDPVHHEKFMEAASLAEHVFTTDENMVESYRQRTGNHSIHALPFAAQPALHKPAALAGRIDRACFAGSWYGNRHLERGKAMKWLLHAALKHGLDIFDRNHGSGNFPFPEEYQEGIRGGLPYRELCREYARYRLFLNVNSVTDSPTMFSRRVFELLACGTPVVSTYSRGLEELFESDAVWLVRNEAEADKAIHTLLTDDKEWRRRSLVGIREVFSRHTYAHRINRIFEVVGVSERIVTEPRVLLLARAGTQSDLDRLFELAEQQSYGRFSLLVECDPAVQTTPVLPHVQLVDKISVQFLNSTLTRNADAIGWVDAAHGYGPGYLQDLVNAMSYQPDAGGWAKAISRDAFRFGEETCQMAAIWKPEIFTHHWINAVDETVSSENLFCIDTDEFTAADSKGPGNVGLL